MTSRVIKLTDNNNTTLLPISDARAIHISYAGQTKSVLDAILDTEEAIATTYNNLDSRVANLEFDASNLPILDTSNSNSQTPMNNEEIEGTIYLHKVAKTGDYDDLLNKPTIPAAPVKSNWNETNSSSLAYILNKPTIPAAPGTLNTNNTSAQSVSSSESLSGNINLHKISKTGNYNDLRNAPNTPVTLKSDEDVYASIDTEFNKENGAIFLSYANDPLVGNDVDNFVLSKNDYTGSSVFTYFSNISPDGTINIISIDESDNKEKISLPLFYILDDTDSATLYNIIDGSNDAAQASRNLLGEHVYNALDNNKTVKWRYNIGSNEYTLIFDFENNAENQHFEMFASRQGILIKVEGTKSSSNWTITVTKTSFAVATQLKTVNSTSLIGNGDVAITKRVTATWNNSTNVYVSSMNVDDIYTAVYSQSCVVELHFINGDWNGMVLNCQGGYTDGNTRHMIFSGQASGNLIEADVVGTAVTLNWGSLDDLYGELGGKQPTLVSGTNIKTVNSESLLGSGNIDADDVEIGYLKTTSRTIQEGQGLPITITSTDFYKVNSISEPSGGAVYEYSETAETGEYGKIYVDVSTNKIYHYKKSGISSNNNDYVELSPSPANYPKGYWIGTCDVASATVAKVILSASYPYVTGNVLAVRFLYGNTVANPTLRIVNRTIGSSITGGTAYPIYYEGHALTDTTLIGANSTVTFVFDGSYYHIISIETNINNLISNAKTTKFGYLDSSGDFYEAYWSTLTDTTTSYYLPAVDQNTLSYTDNLYIDINTGKNYRYKNGTLGTGETRFEEIKPCIAKEKIVRTDRIAFRASNGSAINMESKYFYIFGSLYWDEDEEWYTKLITRLEIASLVNSYDDSKYENDFHAMVYCGSSGTTGKMVLSLPAGIKIANDGTLPDLEEGYLFEFHILNGILTFTYTQLI